MSNSLSVAVMSRLALFALLSSPAVALHAYGHAYARPNDFTASQFKAIATDFEIFTVEKEMAVNVYGTKGAPAPFKSNSIAASVGTARKIKALNPNVKVLMYWNSALFFNFYECESEVDQHKWLMPGPHQPFYNYSVPEFRAWWVKCAVEAVQNSSGALDGLFFDATPKLEAAKAVPLWGAMVEQIKAQLGAEAIVMDNGYYLSGASKMLGGDDAWSHTKFGYIESLTKIGNTAHLTVTQSMTYLRLLSNASAAHPAPSRKFIGHGVSGTNTSFYFSLATFMLITSSMRDGWFLANSGSYSIDGGLLDQPFAVYAGDDGVGCGEPKSTFFEAAGSIVTRAFATGTVVVDLGKQTSTIKCTGKVTRRGAAL